eukprot:TRINITY_DN23432_c0_g1_i1.p1 TRINITY_DN23432_c0_g1~~TRINITY_DN23432_c0_g1_i1.p1  ORF type:complete len:300 (-),score=31.37 TRINITY_DN23432_c0_g1_i1:37-936(-)
MCIRDRLNMALKIFDQDNEVNASIACKLLTETIKSKQRAWNLSNFFHHILRFCEARTKCNKILNSYQYLCREGLNQQPGGQRVLIRNSDSFKFLSDITNLMLYVCSNESSDVARGIAKNIFTNLIDALRQMNLSEFKGARQLDRATSSEIYGCLIKILQFFYVWAKKNSVKDNLKEYAPIINDCLSNYGADLASFTINFLKYCADDPNHRIEILATLKMLIKSIKKECILPFLDDLADEAVIFGTNKFLTNTFRIFVAMNWFDILTSILTEIIPYPAAMKLIFLATNCLLYTSPSPRDS